MEGHMIFLAKSLRNRASTCSCHKWRGIFSLAKISLYFLEPRLKRNLLSHKLAFSFALFLF